MHGDSSQLPQDVLYQYKLSQYQRLVGGITSEQLVNEDPYWIEFVLMTESLEAEKAKQSHGK